MSNGIESPAQEPDLSKVLAAETFGRDVLDEVKRAMSKHKPLNSAHEAYAVILEEVDEFWDEVKMRREMRSRSNMRTELKQIAAMAIRAVVDLGLDE